MKLKKYFKIFSAISISLLMLSYIKSISFNSHTHASVTKISLKKINEISKTLNEHKQLSEESNLIVQDLAKYNEHIISSSLQPDNDDNQGGTYKGHFYNPITKKNFLGEKKTALTKCVKHYETALLSYSQGNKQEAYEHLGRCIHFLEDLSTCVHTGYDHPTDAIIKLQLHIHFEKICDKISDKCNAEMPIESLEYYEANNLENIANATASTSNDNFYRLEHICSENYENIEKELSRNCVINAQKRVIGLIYKFIKEAKI